MLLLILINLQNEGKTYKMCEFCDDFAIVIDKTYDWEEIELAIIIISIFLKKYIDKERQNEL